MSKNNRIAILTGGGDCPGINAVIRAVTKKAILDHDMQVIGIEDGFGGVIRNKHRMLNYDDVSGIITSGGTILGTSNIENPYRYAVKQGKHLEFQDMSKTAIANIKALDIDCLVCIGGDGTLTIANQLYKDGIPIVGIPKTIDNDMRGTDISFGFDSAVAVAAEGIDRLRTTGQSHHRVMIMEVMGRNAGWIALHAGIAGGGDIILMPEIPYEIGIIAKRIKERSRKGRRCTIVVVSEGAKPVGGTITIREMIKESTDPIRLGGIGYVLAAQIEKATGRETRTVILGHLQRGGAPTQFDRVLATRLGVKAVDMIETKMFGYMAAVKGNGLIEVPLEEVAGGQRLVSPDDTLVKAAQSVGTSFGA